MGFIEVSQNAFPGKGNRKTPPPEPPELNAKRGCAAFVLIPSFVLAASAFSSGRWWMLCFCVPALLVVAYWGHGKILLFCAYLAYRRRGIVGVLITSDSPNWATYIERVWIKEYEPSFIILNWSQRNKWDNGLASKLFYRFCFDGRNFCPAIIFLRGLRYPLIFRFFYAFRDYKHGTLTALRGLEDRLKTEMAKKKIRGQGA